MFHQPQNFFYQAKTKLQITCYVIYSKTNHVMWNLIVIDVALEDLISTPIYSEAMAPQSFIVISVASAQPKNLILTSIWSSKYHLEFRLNLYTGTYKGTSNKSLKNSYHN